jgi:hypothetical protein
MDPIITLGATAVADVVAFAGTMFTDLWGLIALAIGIPLAFYIIGRVISLVRTRSRR